MGCSAAGYSVLVPGCWLSAAGCRLLAMVCGFQDTICYDILESRVQVVVTVVCKVVKAHSKWC